MKKLISVLLFTVLLLFSLSGSGSAAVLYDNGPVNGTLDAFNIANGLSVADSFTLSSTSTVTGVVLYTWISGDTPGYLDWYITSGPFSGSLGVTTYNQGIVSLSNTFLGTNTYGYNIYKDTFNIPSTTLPGGTYWLQLDNARGNSDSPNIFWDDNNGPSQAWQTGTGNLNDFNGVPGNNSEAFQILGTTTLPEPSTMLLLGSGLVGLVAFRKRFRA